MSTPYTPKTEGSEPFVQDNAMDLRTSLIGNKDLKFRVLNDFELIQRLVESLHKDINDLTTSTAHGEDVILQKLRHVSENVVVIQLVVSFILELKQLQMLPNGFLNVITPLSASLMRFLELHFELLSEPQSSFQPHMATIEGCSISCLEILITLSNLNGSCPQIYSQSLWRFILSSAFSTIELTTPPSKFLESVLLLVPLCLSTFTVSSTDFRLVEALLGILLVCLSKQCSNGTIITFPSNFITTLITCAAQILAYFETKNFLSRSLELIFSVLPQVFKLLLSCIKSSDHASALASLNLYFFLLKAQETSLPNGESKRRRAYEAIIPKTTEMLVGDACDCKVKRLYLLSPTRILANICLHHPRVTENIRKTGLDVKIMKKLDENYTSNQIFKFFTKLKKKSNGGLKVVDFKHFLELDESSVSDISDCLLFLSVFTSEKEEHRERVLGYGRDEKLKGQVLPRLLFETVDNYRFLLLQLHLIHSIIQGQGQSEYQRLPTSDATFFGNNLGIIMRLLANSCFTNNFYLIRSLSRSVSLLRTFFVECNALVSIIGSKSPATSEPYTDRFASPNHSGGLISNILCALRDTETGDDVLKTYAATSSPASFIKSCRKIQVLNKSIVLGITANFVLDFSSFRYDIVNDQDFIEQLEYIFTRAALDTDGTVEDDLEKEENCLQMQTIQLNVLQIVKNYMYNENQDNKIELLSYFKLSTIFDKTLIGITRDWREKTRSPEVRQLYLKQKIVAFDILRNLTAGSPHFSEHLTDAFEKEYLPSVSNAIGIPGDWTDYLICNIVNFELFDPKNGDSELFAKDDILLSRLNDGDYVSLLLAVNYIEDHRFTSMESFVGYDLPRDDLLSIWLRFLKLYVSREMEERLDMSTRMTISNGLNSIKLLIVWIIINLTWKDDVVGYQYPLESSYRLYDTVQGGRQGMGAPPMKDTIEIEVDDADEGKEPRGLRTHALSSPVQRARYLRRFGFFKALEVLSENLTVGSKRTPDGNDSTMGQISYPGQRFDDFVSNDLLEKVKTAQNQLQPSRSKGKEKRVGPRSSNKGSTTSRQAQRPDLNRGGEGFGYGSDEEYADAHEHTTHERHEGTDDQSDEVHMESAAEYSDDDEPWIH